MRNRGESEATTRRPLFWVGSSRADLRTFPKAVRTAFGQALDDAQHGGMHPHAKPLKGFGGAGVVEAVETHDGNAYRAVFAVRFVGAVYVLHAFQKKSKSGIAMPPRDVEKIAARLKEAQRHHEANANEKRSDED